MNKKEYKHLCTKQFFLIELQRELIYELVWVAHNYCHLTKQHPNDNEQIKKSLDVARVMIELNEDEKTKKLVNYLQKTLKNRESQICD